MFVKLKNGDIRHVVEIENGKMTVQDSSGVQTVINPDDIAEKITKWTKVLQLLIQFAGVLIGLFKKN